MAARKKLGPTTILDTAHPPQSVADLLEDIAKVTGGEQLRTPTERDIAEVCDGIKAMLITKNRAYGDSALKPMRVFSRADNVEQIKVRLDDKISRLCRGHALPDESLADTVNDLMGYLVLLKIAVKRATDEGRGARL